MNLKEMLRQYHAIHDSLRMDSPIKVWRAKLRHLMMSNRVETAKEKETWSEIIQTMVIKGAKYQGRNKAIVEEDGYTSFIDFENRCYGESQGNTAWTRGPASDALFIDDKMCYVVNHNGSMSWFYEDGSRLSYSNDGRMTELKLYNEKEQLVHAISLYDMEYAADIKCSKRYLHTHVQGALVEGLYNYDEHGRIISCCYYGDDDTLPASTYDYTYHDNHVIKSCVSVCCIQNKGEYVSKRLFFNKSAKLVHMIDDDFETWYDTTDTIPSAPFDLVFSFHSYGTVGCSSGLPVSRKNKKTDEITYYDDNGFEIVKSLFNFITHAYEKKCDKANERLKAILDNELQWMSIMDYKER